MGTPFQDSGASLSTAIRASMMFGACSEQDWTYENETTKFLIPPTPNCYILAREHVNLDDVTLASVSQDATEIERILSQGTPLVFGVNVYNSFLDTKIDGIVSTPTEAERGNPTLYLGGHAVMLVGYDRPNQRFTVRNSWGDQWGEKGYCYMSYGYVLNPDLTMDFWTVSKVGLGKTPLDTIANQGVIPLIDKINSVISEIWSFSGLKSTPSQAIGYALSIPSRTLNYALSLPSRAFQYSFSIPKRIVLSLLAPFTAKNETAGEQIQKI